MTLYKPIKLANIAVLKLFGAIETLSMLVDRQISLWDLFNLISVWFQLGLVGLDCSQGKPSPALIGSVVSMR